MKFCIQPENDRCYLCGRTDRPRDRHHVFGGTANRDKSEEYGLTVYLCHMGCHMYGPRAVHDNIEADRKLKQEVQKIAMEHYGWTVDEWREIFGKNYL